MNKKSDHAQAWTFITLALGWTWIFLLPAVPLSLSGRVVAVNVLRVLAGIGPAVVAIGLLLFRDSRKEREDYWQRLIGIRPVPPVWWGISLLTVPVLTGLAALIDQLLGGWGWQLEAAERFIKNPLSIIPFLLFILVFGPLPEELGWRGYALGKLQSRWSALYASIILGIVWVIWHLPLFFIQGTYQYGLGLGTRAYWIFNLGLVITSVIYTWIYNNTGGSIPAVILFHFSQNFSGELVELSESAELIHFQLTFILAVLVVVIWGWDKMVGKSTREDLT